MFVVTVLCLCWLFMSVMISVMYICDVYLIYDDLAKYHKAVQTYRRMAHSKRDFFIHMGKYKEIDNGDHLPSLLDNITDEEIRNRTKSDPHSLGRWRVNGALPHVDAWYEAFGIKEGDKMFIPKSERLELW